MPAFAALLRAVNVGGTGKLPMSELRSLCSELGFGNVRTYIQSGNLVLDSDLDADGVKGLLERALEERMGKPVQVFIRTPEELDEVLRCNPYTDAAPNRVLVLFLDRPVPAGTVEAVDAPGGEQLTSGDREIYLFFPDGQGRSKLKVPMAGEGTARNLNTVRKLVEMCRAG
ncbi:MAG: DUF1697 domain-containing protein [Gemmatimonadetes bacterium]|nr:DUF1697 domain-containing protein [Gemmatimonadota bacterium]